MKGSGCGFFRGLKKVVLQSPPSPYVRCSGRYVSFSIFFSYRNSWG